MTLSGDQVGGEAPVLSRGKFFRAEEPGKGSEPE